MIFVLMFARIITVMCMRSQARRRKGAKHRNLWFQKRSWQLTHQLARAMPIANRYHGISIGIVRYALI